MNIPRACVPTFSLIVGLVLSGCSPHIRVVQTIEAEPLPASCPVEQLEMTFADAFATEKYDMLGSIEVLDGFDKVDRQGDHVDDEIPAKVCEMGGTAFVYKGTGDTADRSKVTYAVLRPKAAAE